MSKPNQKVVALGDRAKPWFPLRDVEEPQVATSGPDRGREPTPEESLRLIQAFRRVTDLHQREWLIEQTEGMARQR